MALEILKIIGCELEYYAVNCAPSFGEDPKIMGAHADDFLNNFPSISNRSVFEHFRISISR